MNTHKQTSSQLQMIIMTLSEQSLGRELTKK